MENIQFVAEVMKYPYIVDTKNPDHRDQAKIRKAWESIATALTPHWQYCSLSDKVERGILYFENKYIDYTPHLNL